jgi:hypothetical protein
LEISAKKKGEKGFALRKKDEEDIFSKSGN